jgi:hypothetical protein
MLTNQHAPAPDESPQGDSDYDSILAALMQTARGRAFLEEHARRSRAEETANLLAALARIENLLMSRGLDPAAIAHANGIAVADIPAAELGEGVGDAANIVVVEEPVNGAVVMEMAATGLLAMDVAESREIETAAPDAADHITGNSAPDASASDAIGQDVFEAGPVIDTTPPPAGPAIEFLGPDPEMSQREQDAIRRNPDDPFADIRALSEEEKIALFA